MKPEFNWRSYIQTLYWLSKRLSIYLGLRLCWFQSVLMISIAHTKQWPSLLQQAILFLLVTLWENMANWEQVKNYGSQKKRVQRLWMKAKRKNGEERSLFFVAFITPPRHSFSFSAVSLFRYLRCHLPWLSCGVPQSQDLNSTISLLHPKTRKISCSICSLSFTAFRQEKIAEPFV